MLLADIALWPGGVLAWLLVGLIAGALAGTVMRGSGYGILGDIIVGLIGSVVGGFLVSLFDTGVAGFWGSVFVSFIGACVLIAIVRAFAPRRVM
ncbi:MAG: GlsB/YeaQ/YmgE family stress response rane protein [Planctomycetota bacterium]|nr:GlsB/YeaQ/YmgE family stress response rane protein [Planctomycetota bacterium]